MIEIRKNGMVKEEHAIASGLPIFNFIVDENPGIKLDHCDEAQLKLLNIHLDEWERGNLIVGFYKEEYFRGVKPLYSLEQIRKLKGF